MKKISGTLTVHPDGYGFVVPDQSGVPDIFIPARAIWPALHRDRVVVVPGRPDQRGRLEGKIVEVLEHGLRQLVGRYEQAGRGAVVVPDDPRIGHRVAIGKNQGGGAKHGNTVVVEIVQFPDARQTMTGRVTCVLGRRGDLTTEVDTVIHCHVLPTAFSPELLAAADAVYRAAGTPDATRKDLRATPFVTIDGETAKDFDDAVSAAPAADGSIRIWVAIADVSHYVRPGSLLDQEALARGTSVYFPGRCLPMLPPQLSDDLCSLRPDVERLVVVAEFSVTAAGQVERPMFYRARIRSRARLTYTLVHQLLETPASSPQPLAPDLLQMLRCMAEACRCLQRQRRARGSVDFDLPEPEIVLDMQGGPEAIIRAERNCAHQMIEELMIAANESVAQVLTTRGRGCLYRVHAPPDPDKMREFGELLKHLEVSVRCTVPPRPADLARVLAAVRGRPEERWINHSLLRSMAQAVYDTKNVGHFGLASKCYCHFTSPIRRYPDLVIHRLLCATLDGRFQTGGTQKTRDAGRRTQDDLRTIAQHCSLRERVAVDAEREMAKVYAAFFLRERIGMTFEAMVSHVTKRGLFVELAEFFVEGLVRAEDLPGERYLFDAKHPGFVGKKTGRAYRIGNRCRVRLEEVKVESREVRFVIDLSSEKT